MHINKYMFGNMSGMSAMGFTYIFRQMGSFLMVHGFGNVSAASLVLGECGLQRKSHRKSGLQDRQVCWIVRSAGRKRRIVGKSGKSPQPPQVRSVRSIVSKKPSKFCRCNVCQRTTCRLNQDASVKLPLEKMPL